MTQRIDIGAGLWAEKVVDVHLSWYCLYRIGKYNQPRLLFTVMVGPPITAEVGWRELLNTAELRAIADFMDTLKESGE